MSDRAGKPVEKQFDNAGAQAVALAAEIGQRLKTAVAERGSATIAVSGGKSPIRLFQLLSQQSLPWSSITITLVDERWVPPSDEASNEKLVRDHLMVGAAASARLLPMKNAATTPEEGAAELNVALARLSLPIDVVVLGMGDDGHTASLFPHAPGLDHALTTKELSAGVRPQTAPHPRITLTLSALQASRWLVLPLQGEAKLRTYRTALDAGPVEDMPVRSLLRQASAPIEVWIVN